MTKRVRDGSITLDDYDAQSLEVVRQVGRGLSMIGLDHLIHNDYVCNPLLSDLIIDFDNEPGIDRLEIQRKRILPNVLHMRWSFAVSTFREMCSRLILLS